MSNYCKNFLSIFTLFFLLSGCLSNSQESNSNLDSNENENAKQGVELIVLGTIQDAGSPHIACKKICCKDLFENPDPTRKVVSLGLVDHDAKKTYMFEATPDMTSQMKMLSEASSTEQEFPNAIFITHAHIGHYTGLMYLGKEATNSKDVPVYAMPKMREFLSTNGPWSQLVNTGNISLQNLTQDSTLNLSSTISVTPFNVPHRDEYSETVGYKIAGPRKSVLFIPDIDKWEKWSESIIEEIKKVDFAFLDATFFDAAEINNRDISLIPHPFVVESMEKFAQLSKSEKEKIYFIHFNHTNPIINLDSKQAKSVTSAGFKIASYNLRLKL